MKPDKRVPKTPVTGYVPADLATKLYAYAERFGLSTSAALTYLLTKGLEADGG